MIKVGANNIISPLGWTTEENFQNVIDGRSGIVSLPKSSLSDVPLLCSQFNWDLVNEKWNEKFHDSSFSKLERLAILSISDIIANIDVENEKTGLLFSTTKGNIDLLADRKLKDELGLSETANKIAQFLGFKSQPQVISNACISGVAAFVVAKRLIDSGIYNQVVVVGVEVLSKFIVSGFQSFQSLSAEPCKPYDADRNGLTLGEAVASVVLSKVDKTALQENDVLVANGAISNDANHISGPSRTGEGLFRAIKQTLDDQDRVDMICAHGTATPYNDDMESQAISRSGFESTPVFGLKGYFGHTLGAAGVIESLISIKCLSEKKIIGTKGHTKFGVVSPIHVVKETTDFEATGLLKLMSGFGGCNASVYFKKI